MSTRMWNTLVAAFELAVVSVAAWAVVSAFVWLADRWCAL